ncbi:MAG: hypothetical protein D4R57_01520 [Verrucomicrobiales bacterium]|nr:MAG: hypothetical protein D4R57_01520 [Verrucomicrobiales bacterium]
METQATDAANQQCQETDVNIPLPLDAKSVDEALSEGLKIASGETVETEEEPAQGQQQEEPSGSTAEEQPPAEPQQQVDPATGKILPNRINTAQFSGDEQEAIKLRKELRDSGQDVTLKEALELVEDRKKKSQPDQGQQQQPAQTNPEQALRDELAQVEKQLDTAAESELYTKEVRDLEKRRSQLERDVERLDEAKAQRENNVKAERMTAREKVKQETLQAFPSVADPNSELGKEVTRLIAEMKDESHPDHPMLFSEKAPKLVTQLAAEKVAERMAADGSMMVDQALAKLKSNGKAPAPTTQQAPQQKQRVNPASGSAGTILPDRPVTEKELMAAVSANPALADELLGAKSGGWVIQ